MGKRIERPDAPFQGIQQAAAITGLSVSFLRRGCKVGSIPHVMCGREYRVNIPALLTKLNTEGTEQCGRA